MDDDLEDYELDTVFEREAGTILHTSWMQDRARGLRKVRVKERWHRKREVGVGSFGTVYLEETEDGRQRAVKAIRKRLAEKFKIDHKRELAALTILSRSKHLQHQTFVEFFGWFEDEEFMFLAMEYVPHGDLSMYNGGIKDDDAKKISQQLLEGLQIMHKKGFTHRDLKPQNIFVVQTAPSWWVKIGDFGISKRIKPGDATELRTETGAMGYEAPEIRGLVSDVESQGSSVYTNAVDMWSLGCVIYKIVTKKVPFPTSSDLRGFCDGRVVFPSSALEGKISEEGIRFLNDLLRSQPMLRPTAPVALQHKWLQFEVPEEVVFNTMEMRHAISHARTIPPGEKKPIRFKDCIGRKFSIPFHMCQTWMEMEEMIRQISTHIDIRPHIRPHMTEGHYNLIGPNNQIITPEVWEMMIEPDWAVTMQMWPLPEPALAPSIGASTPRSRVSSKDSSRGDSITTKPPREKIRDSSKKLESAWGPWGPLGLSPKNKKPSRKKKS